MVESGERLKAGRAALERGQYREAVELIEAAHAQGPDEETSYWLGQATYQATQALAPDPMAAEPGRVVDYVELLLVLEMDLAHAIETLPARPEFDDERATLRHRLAWVRRSVRDQVRYARARLRWDRAAAIDTLDRLFELGRPPATPLDGPYRGQLVAITVAPVLDRLLNGLARKWLPWRGKRFGAAAARGDNIFTQDSRRLLAWRWPDYTAYVDDPAPEPGLRGTFRAFPFRTWTGRGVVDPIDTLKIDYDLPENPPDIRRVVDELVELSHGFYLGKAHYQRQSGQWLTAAFFSLQP